MASRTSRLLATPTSNYKGYTGPRGKPAPTPRAVPPSSASTASRTPATSAVAPAVKQAEEAGAADSRGEWTSDLEGRFYALSQTLKETTDQLHVAHMEIKRHKAAIRSLEHTMQQQQQQKSQLAASESSSLAKQATTTAAVAVTATVSSRFDLSFGHSAFDRKIVAWLVRNGAMSTSSAKDEEERLTRPSITALPSSSSGPMLSTPLAETVYEVRAAPSRAVVHISLDLDDEGEGEGEGEGDLAQPTATEPVEAPEEKEVEALVDSASPAAPVEGSGGVASTESLCAGETRNSAAVEDAGGRENSGNGIGDGKADGGGGGDDGDESSVDSGFGDLGVEELPQSEIELRQSENRKHLTSFQTPVGDGLCDDEDDDDEDDGAMTLIYSKPGIASSAVHISATDLYVVILSELMELKQTLQESGTFLEVYSRREHFKSLEAFRGRGAVSSED